MSGQGIFFGIIVFVAVIAAFWYLNNKNVQAALQAARISNLVQIVSNGTENINFVLAAAPLVITEHEKIVAVLPNTTLFEPKTVRVRKGTRASSSMRMGFGYSSGSGSYTSTTESREQLQTADQGTLVVTNQRVAFLGALKTISIEVNKIIGVDQFCDEIGVHCKNKEKVESFKISDDLMLTYHEDQKAVSVPFPGQVLELLINRAVAGQGVQNRTVAA